MEEKDDDDDDDVGLCCCEEEVVTLFKLEDARSIYRVCLLVLYQYMGPPLKWRFFGSKSPTLRYARFLIFS